MKWDERADGGCYAFDEGVLIKPEGARWVMMMLDVIFQPQTYSSRDLAIQAAERIWSRRATGNAV